jgi:Antitoxin-like ribbon-helix-helix
LSIFRVLGYKVIRIYQYKGIKKMATRAKIQLKPRLTLEETASPPPDVDRAQTPLYEGRNPKRPDRAGKKIIAGHFPKATWVRFRNLCTKHEKTAQQLLEEALTDLFSKYG